MKVQAGTPMTEVIKQYAELSGIDEAECRFLVGGKPLKTDKPRAAAPRAAPPRAPPPPPCPAPAPSERRAVPGNVPRAGSTSRSR